MSAIPQSFDANHSYVERRAGVQGGRPVIKGTRFPVSSIVQNYRRGLTVEEILRDFPHLTPSQVYGALAWYFDHRAEIDQEIAQMRDLNHAMTHVPPTLRPADVGDQDLS